MKKSVKPSIQSESKKADEIEKPEVEKPEIEITEAEIIPSKEIKDENLDIEDDQEETPEQIEENATVTETKIKPIPENTEVTNKTKIKALKRSVDNKKYAIAGEEAKVKLWRIQGKDRDSKATDEFEKRKSELEALLKKNQERFDKRMSKTKKWWWE